MVAEGAYGTMMFVLIIFFIILGILALFIPIFVYQIRNRLISIDKKMTKLISAASTMPTTEDIDQGRGYIKGCPYCYAENNIKASICENCGKPI